jgi:hypothetical protein
MASIVAWMGMVVGKTQVWQNPDVMLPADGNVIALSRFAGKRNDCCCSRGQEPSCSAAGQPDVDLGFQINIQGWNCLLLIFNSKQAPLLRPGRRRMQGTSSL